VRIRSSLASQGSLAATRGVGEPRERRALGEVLDLSPSQQDAVVQRQAETGHLFGETAVELGFVTSDQVHRAIKQQQGFSVLDDGDSRLDPLIVTAFDPGDVLARIARNLRSTLTAAVRPNGQPVRSVALIGQDTSAELPILVANLAVACAQTGSPTLLVDANLDHPHQHALFRVRNRTGVATMLASNATSGLIQQSAIGGLSLLTTGPAVPNASELFDRQRLANTIEMLSEDFDLVLVDAGCEATALAAAKGLDAAIIVLRRNVSLTRGTRVLVEQLETTGQVVLGTVLVD
jgi:protein-tyrosine kinase